ncbi:alanine racemase [Dermacoccus sp. Tok2021]|uniref:alanine racemase n=1 Tax=Dermacoccus sp. Tok2021 TaxID=2826873 RepID=UPI001CA740E8|nr:alanine racemase [Dermacoccus sp. Tok2021]MBZ4496605.1 alanine racemase [Dermacoccus sp. Tok2021]
MNVPAADAPTPSDHPAWLAFEGAQARVVVDLDAIVRNATTLKARVGDAQLMAVVKGDAYGHGLVPTARAALRGGATWLGVAQLHEATALRDAGIDARVLCWLLAPGSDFETAIRRDIDLGVSSAAMVRDVAIAAEAAGRAARVHLKVDTGMARNGAYGDQWPELVAAAREARGRGFVEVVGLFTHFVRSDEPRHPEVAAQIDRFCAAEKDCDDAGFHLEVRHMANSAGAIFVPESRFDLVRVGLALYGLSPAPDLATPQELGLDPAMSVTAHVAVTKRVPAGQGVSYGHTYVTDAETTLADIPAGYADGVPRHGSNKAPVMVNGTIGHIAGRVCMDQFVVDMGDAAVQPGDEAVLFGRAADGTPGPTAQEWADAADTISYEIVTRMSTRLPRIYCGDLSEELTR